MWEDQTLVTKPDGFFTSTKFRNKYKNICAQNKEIVIRTITDTVDLLTMSRQQEKV